MKSDIRVDDLPDDLQSLIDESEQPSVPSTPLVPAEPTKPPFRAITQSILYTIKKMLGISQEYLAFDTDIITNINSTFFTLYQLGVGPYPPFSIEGPDEVWTDFLPETDQFFKAVRTYIYQKVRLMFDPPSTGFQLESITQQIAELEWRFTVQPIEDLSSGDSITPGESNIRELTAEEVKEIYEKAKKETITEEQTPKLMAARVATVSAPSPKMVQRTKAIQRVKASRKTPKELFR